MLLACTWCSGSERFLVREARSQARRRDRSQCDHSRASRERSGGGGRLGKIQNLSFCMHEKEYLAKIVQFLTHFEYKRLFVHLQSPQNDQFTKSEQKMFDF